MATGDIFWTIPPIQDNLGEYLTRTDHRNCIQVSKSLRTAFIPFLWRHITLNKEKITRSFITSAGQDKNRHHIRTLNVNRYYLYQWSDYLKQYGVLPNLTSLQFGNGYGPREFPTMEPVEWIAAHPKLEQLTMRCDTFVPGFLLGFSQAMDRMKHLWSLDLGLQSVLTAHGLSIVLSACKNLNELQFSFVCCPKVTHEEARAIEFPLTRIKDLRFSGYNTGTGTVLVRFLASCPQLVRLRVQKDFDTAGIMEQLGSALREHCPRFSELIYGYLLRPDITAILDRCPSLTRLTASLPFGTQVLAIPAIITHHRQTLRNLDLTKACTITMMGLISVMESCPWLESLAICVYWSKKFRQWEFCRDKLRDQPWVCGGLKSFEVYFQWEDDSDSDSEFDDDDGDEEEEEEEEDREETRSESDDLSVVPFEDQLLDGFYQQLGRLTSLGVLQLTTNDKAVEFKNILFCNLDQLSGLKAMRVFGLILPRHTFLEADEQDRIVDQWPRLVSVYGAIYSDSGSGLDNDLPRVVARRAHRET